MKVARDASSKNDAVLLDALSQRAFVDGPKEGVGGAAGRYWKPSLRIFEVCGQSPWPEGLHTHIYRKV